MWDTEALRSVHLERRKRPPQEMCWGCELVRVGLRQNGKREMGGSPLASQRTHLTGLWL